MSKSKSEKLVDAENSIPETEVTDLEERSTIKIFQKVVSVEDDEDGSNEVQVSLHPLQEVWTL